MCCCVITMNEFREAICVRAKEIQRQKTTIRERPGNRGRVYQRGDRQGRAESSEIPESKRDFISLARFLMVFESSGSRGVVQGSVLGKRGQGEKSARCGATTTRCTRLLTGSGEAERWDGEILFSAVM